MVLFDNNSVIVGFSFASVLLPRISFIAWFILFAPLLKLIVFAIIYHNPLVLLKADKYVGFGKGCGPVYFIELMFTFLGKYMLYRIAY